jgi:hypothetical protein
MYLTTTLIAERTTAGLIWFNLGKILSIIYSVSSVFDGM